MFSGRLAAVVLAASTCGTLAGCEESESAQPESVVASLDSRPVVVSTDPSIGVRRDPPRTACDWLSKPDAADLLADFSDGIDQKDLVTEEVGNTETSFRACYYKVASDDATIMTTLFGRIEPTTRLWRDNMADLARQGGHSRSNGTELTLIRVADAPALQDDAEGECLVTAVTGDVLTIQVMVLKENSEALGCAAARSALATVISNLPEPD